MKGKHLPLPQGNDLTQKTKSDASTQNCHCLTKTGYGQKINKVIRQHAGYAGHTTIQKRRCGQRLKQKQNCAKQRFDNGDKHIANEISQRSKNSLDNQQKPITKIVEFFTQPRPIHHLPLTESPSERQKT
ncbi:hypothetical protein [Silvimonas soli]|uniref:hypothetical protein n=1 Tax=Silvimonas soli TaxID=2980100 RepID=UPI0024B324C5|nr:hypothetical protein [Silvimonas soli]